jgi:hypothetical protein
MNQDPGCGETSGFYGSDLLPASAAEFLRMLAEIEDDPDNAAFRWGLMILDSLRMVLQLQSLPASASSTYSI